MNGEDADVGNDFLGGISRLVDFVASVGTSPLWNRHVNERCLFAEFGDAQISRSNRGPSRSAGAAGINGLTHWSTKGILLPKI